MEGEAALQRELESQLSSLQRKGRIYFGTYPYSVLPPFTRAIVEKVTRQIHDTLLLSSREEEEEEGSRLEELGFCSCSFGEGGVQALEEFLSTTNPAATTHLESLVFSDVQNIQYDEVARLVWTCSNLRMVKVSMAATVPPEQRDVPARGRPPPPPPVFFGTGGSLAHFMYSARRLQVLDLLGLESSQMDDFADGLVYMQQLRELHISMKHVSHHHITATLQSLLNVTRLDSLDLRLNPPSSFGRYDQGCLKALTKLLQQGRLNSLILASIPSLFDLPSSDPQSTTLVDFFGELRTNQSLRRLELGHLLGIREDHAVAIFQALEENTTLSRFSWNTTLMLEKTWSGLLTSIPKLQHLSELTFSGIGPGVAAMDDKLKADVLVALRQNMSLTNFRYERGFDIFATDRAEELLEIAVRNSQIGRARVAVEATMSGFDDDNDTSRTIIGHGMGGVAGGRHLAVWKDDYWPLLMAKWGKRSESCSALYYIVQRRAIHWIQQTPSSNKAMTSGRKRPLPLSSF